MGELSVLPNIGKVVEEQLNAGDLIGCFMPRASFIDTI